MVTTIKITCDGVFIQTNSFLNPIKQNRTADESMSVTAVTSSSLSSSNHHQCDKTSPCNKDNIKENDNYEIDGIKITSKTISNELKYPKAKGKNCNQNYHQSNRKIGNRRHYYFGSQNLLCCKQNQQQQQRPQQHHSTNPYSCHFYKSKSYIYGERYPSTTVIRSLSRTASLSLYSNSSNNNNTKNKKLNSKTKGMKKPHHIVPANLPNNVNNSLNGIKSSTIQQYISPLNNNVEEQQKQLHDGNHDKILETSNKFTNGITNNSNSNHCCNKNIINKESNNNTKNNRNNNNNNNNNSNINPNNNDDHKKLLHILRSSCKFHHDNNNINTNHKNNNNNSNNFNHKGGYSLSNNQLVKSINNCDKIVKGRKTDNYDYGDETEHNQNLTPLIPKESFTDHNNEIHSSSLTVLSSVSASLLKENLNVTKATKAKMTMATCMCDDGKIITTGYKNKFNQQENIANNTNKNNSNNKNTNNNIGVGQDTFVESATKADYEKLSESSIKSPTKAFNDDALKLLLKPNTKKECQKELPEKEKEKERQQQLPQQQLYEQQQNETEKPQHLQSKFKDNITIVNCCWSCTNNAATTRTTTTTTTTPLNQNNPAGNINLKEVKRNLLVSASALRNCQKVATSGNHTSVKINVMNSRISANQNGQTTVVGGHHRGYSQPTVSASTAGDPWFLQSTGHQMPPTAPLRHNKRPAPQPNAQVNPTATGVLNSSGNVLINANNINTTTPTTTNNHQVAAAAAAATVLLQQQLSQSQPHIGTHTTTNLSISTHHHNNANHHHNAVHLSSHALNGHNLITNVIAGGIGGSGANGIMTSNHSPKSPSQQQQQQQQHTANHMLSTFAPIAPNERTASTNSSGNSAIVATTSINCNNNNLLMSSSLNATHSGVSGSISSGNQPLHERGLPPKNVVLGSLAGNNCGNVNSGNILMHNQTLMSNQQQSGGNNMIGQTINPSTSNSSGMSTSLHNFDINGGGNGHSSGIAIGTGLGIGAGNSCNAIATNSATQLWTNSLISPTNVTGMAGSNQLSVQLHGQKKCEVKLNAMPWFHGSITRDEAEHLLQPRDDGLFLVRESTNFPGDYTLCVCFQGKVEHYRVKYLENKLTIDDEEYFENLGQLVAHYEADADGLCTQLIKCLPKQGRQEFCINSKDFIEKGWVIPESDLQLRESIGKGEFGDVLLGILRNEKVAVKMLKDEGAVQKFLAEASVMTTLEHENLVKFIGLVYTSKHIYLVTEYMSKGSLVDYLRSRGRQHITKKDQINFAYDTASGMEYLEAKKVVHRDLAARNVLISEECVAKVSDFGLAREECYNLDVGKLPIKWTAPEALKNGRFSNKSDMWSFGILLWEIYSFGRVPYPRIPLADVVKHVEVGYKMEAPEGCPNEIYEMMRQAWDLNPAKRPTFADLKVKLLHLKNITT